MQTLQAALQSSHEDLQQWFLLHQECLLLGDDANAAKALQAFGDYLRKHMDFEDHKLFVAVDAFDISLRWPLPVYGKEHDKLRQMLLSLEQRFASYQSFSGRYKRLALLELLDEQQRFRHVMEHHEQREEQDLFMLIQELPQNASLLAQWQQIDQQLSQYYVELKTALKNLLAE